MSLTNEAVLVTQDGRIAVCLSDNMWKWTAHERTAVRKGLTDLSLEEWSRLARVLYLAASAENAVRPKPGDLVRLVYRQGSPVEVYWPPDLCDPEEAACWMAKHGVHPGVPLDQKWPRGLNTAEQIRRWLAEQDVPVLEPPSEEELCKALDRVVRLPEDDVLGEELLRSWKRWRRPRLWRRLP